MTPVVLQQRLYDLGYDCTVDEIESYFREDSDLRLSKSRRDAYEINPRARKRLLHELKRWQKVFLSHKGADKPLVRRIDSALRAIGCETWLDEAALSAGRKLERGLLEGMEDSCAAVFFVSPEFKDEGFLETEIDYAVAEKRKKGDRFSIITMVLTSESGVSGVVPNLLLPYVWKEPKSEAEMIQEIVNALPLEIGVAGWCDESA